MTISSSDADYVVIGVILGALILIVMFVIAIVLLLRYRKRRRHQNHAQQLVGKYQEQPAVSKNDNADNNANKKQYQQLSPLTTTSATSNSGKYDTVSNATALSPVVNNNAYNKHQYATAAAGFQQPQKKEKGKRYDNVPPTATEPTAFNNQVQYANVPK
jgi:hypothetical protein